MPTVRVERPLTFMFDRHTLQDTESGEEFTMLAPTDCNALFPSHQVWHGIIAVVAGFYALVMEENLAAINEKGQRAEANRQATRMA